MNNKRLIFADFTKFFAMFVVTWGHCAQCLSGESFPWMFGRQGLSIAFHMPLFMMISGYFINPEKIEYSNWKIYVSNKFYRLMIPAFIWYLLYCLLTIHKPHLIGLIQFYWFLSSMFFSYMIVLVVCKLGYYWGKWIGVNKYYLYLLSIAIVIFFPFSSFLKINFMYPLIWGGYFYKLIIIEKVWLNKYILPVSAIISLFLLYYWDVDYSVYKSPFDLLEMNMSTIKALTIRLLTGWIISIFLISLFKRIGNFKIIRYFSEYGKYTLVMYTASFILNGIMRRILSSIDVSITSPFWIETLSLSWAILVCLICVFLAVRLEQNRFFSKLLLGKC